MEKLTDYKSVLELLKEATIEEDKTFTLLTEKCIKIIYTILKYETFFSNKIFLDDKITLTMQSSKKNKEYYYYFEIDKIIDILTENERAQYDLYMLLLNNNKHQAIKEILNKKID